MFPPSLVYLLIQMAGLYGAFKIGHSSTTYNAKTKKYEMDPFKGGLKAMFDRNPIDMGIIAGFLLLSLWIAMTNQSTGLFGFGGGGYGGGGYGGGYGGGMY